MHLLILVITALVELNSGVPGIVSYSLPDGYTIEALTGDSTFAVTDSENGSFTIVPFLLRDTLQLPYLTAWNDNGDSLQLKPPAVIVEPSFPDTLMNASAPIWPCYMDIPPGLPEDYARNVSFWLVWKESPGFPWILVSIGALLIALTIYFFIRRRRRQEESPEVPLVVAPPGDEAEKEALALLECESFIHGRWPELYAEMDRQLRVSVAGRFGVVNRALTLNQISRSLAATGDGRKFLEDASPIVREIILQLYADWGSSRDRSAQFIRRLASLRKRWAR